MTDDKPRTRYTMRLPPSGSRSGWDTVVNLHRVTNAIQSHDTTERLPPINNGRQPSTTSRGSSRRRSAKQDALPSIDGDRSPNENNNDDARRHRLTKKQQIRLAEEQRKREAEEINSKNRNWQEIKTRLHRKKHQSRGRPVTVQKPEPTAEKRTLADIIRQKRFNDENKKYNQNGTAVIVNHGPETPHAATPNRTIVINRDDTAVETYQERKTTAADGSTKRVVSNRLEIIDHNSADDPASKTDNSPSTKLSVHQTVQDVLAQQQRNKNVVVEHRKMAESNEESAATTSTATEEKQDDTNTESKSVVVDEEKSDGTAAVDQNTVSVDSEKQENVIITTTTVETTEHETTVETKNNEENQKIVAEEVSDDKESERVEVKDTTEQTADEVTKTAEIEDSEQAELEQSDNNVENGETGENNENRSSDTVTTSENITTTTETISVIKTAEEASEQSEKNSNNDDVIKETDESVKMEDLVREETVIKTDEQKITTAVIADDADNKHKETTEEKTEEIKPAAVPVIRIEDEQQQKDSSPQPSEEEVKKNEVKEPDHKSSPKIVAPVVEESTPSVSTDSKPPTASNKTAAATTPRTPREKHELVKEKLDNLEKAIDEQLKNVLDGAGAQSAAGINPEQLDNLLNGEFSKELDKYLKGDPDSGADLMDKFIQAVS
ncbi:uncharacterized protein LOC141907174 [Tubulanus polymorphus]|uniref:uncharacterized protein LOC141907174 n=1 Tax=Tubulanus polymorphus TaxID=672921 RepID=UPI003DA25FB4